MAKTKKTEAPTKKRARRERRTPEELLLELSEKTAKIENKIYKNRADEVLIIGTAILKKAKFDFSEVTESVMLDIQKGTEEGEAFIQNILERASL